MDKIVIYCDGGCRGNQRKENIGGWGVYLEYKGNTREIYGGTENTTNNKMELVSCIESLKALKTYDMPVEVTMDSEYVIKGITQWVYNWIDNGWKTSTGKPPENIDLWVELHELRNKFKKIEFKHCKGHSGNERNDRADMLANIAMDKIEGGKL